MSRKKRPDVLIEGWALHNARIIVEPEIPDAGNFFTNECTGERHAMGSAETAPVQRMETFQSTHGLDKRSWAEMEARDIIADIQRWHQMVREGKVYSLAGPWDYYDYGLMP